MRTAARPCLFEYGFSLDAIERGDSDPGMSGEPSLPGCLVTSLDPETLVGCALGCSEAHERRCLRGERLLGRAAGADG